MSIQSFFFLSPSLHYVTYQQGASWASGETIQEAFSKLILELRDLLKESRPTTSFFHKRNENREKMTFTRVSGN
jgi:hypothetical protein